MTATSNHPSGAPFCVGLAVDTDDAILLTPRGELDMSVVDELEQQVTRFVQPDRAIVLDLSQLDFIDSSGLRVILRASRDCAARGCTLRLRRGNDQVMRTFEVAGLATSVNFEA